MPRSATTPEEKLTQLKQRAAQLQARIQKENAKVRGQNRKRETRRKIIAGALALEHAEKNEGAFRDTLFRLMDEYVTKDDERSLFGLPPLPPKD